ncbi:response regulator transcription factor [Sulfurimonas sp.]|nr:response regulator transcription factor [Sulfurimonas sp.]
MQIMLVEDEYVLNKAIKTYFISKGMKVDAFLDGLEAIDALSPKYDIFILDIDIPHINGIEILEQIHKTFPTTPVIMISATIDMDMISNAYKKGASDYLKKPFDIKELELKIGVFTAKHKQKVKLAENIFYDKDSQLLECDGQEVILTQKEHIFLSLLVVNQGSVVPHEAIETVVWGIDIQSSHLRQLVNRLRNKLPQDLIQNRIGEGYIIL